MTDTPRKTCAWTEGKDGAWDTECEHVGVLLDCIPSDDNWSWCPYCGGRLREVEYRDNLDVTGEER